MSDLSLDYRFEEAPPGSIILTVELDDLEPTAIGCRYPGGEIVWTEDADQILRRARRAQLVDGCKLHVYMEPRIWGDLEGIWEMEVIMEEEEYHLVHSPGYQSVTIRSSGLMEMIYHRAMWYGREK